MSTNTKPIQCPKKGTNYDSAAHIWQNTLTSHDDMVSQKGPHVDGHMEEGRDLRHPQLLEILTA
jgi:hypothetical protein